MTRFIKSDLCQQCVVIQAKRMNSLFSSPAKLRLTVCGKKVSSGWILVY